MSFYTVSLPIIEGVTVFTMAGHVTPLTVDGEGVLTIDTTHGACIVEQGTEIKGIRLVDANGEPLDLEVDDAANRAQFAMIMIESSGPVPLTIIHESEDVTLASERIWVNDGSLTMIDTKRVQMFYQPWLAGGEGRGWALDWAGV